MEDDAFIKIYKEYFPCVYRYLYGITYNHQAGEILGISVSVVTNLIYRARKTLRALRRDINE